MSTMPKVSVVTTTYNDMDNLCRIMEEVRKQTYKNIEHIINLNIYEKKYIADNALSKSTEYYPDNLNKYLKEIFYK